MRNTLEYPITPEEVRTILNRVREDIIDEGRIGDPSPLAIMFTLDFLATKEAEFEAYLKERG